MEKQRKTFLSYSRVNKNFAVRLARELKAEGFDIWLDQLDIPAGARWDREVEKALEESEIFMIILTPASIDSENVLDEIGYAIDGRKRILPVLLEKCNVPFRLRRFQYVDFTDKGFDDGVESAKELLRSLIDQPTIPSMEVPSTTQSQAERETKAQADRKAKEDREAKAEAERIARQVADEEAAAKAEREAKAEADRLAAQKAQAERLAKQKADREVQAETERLARARADREAKAEADRKAKEEAERLATQKAEAERLAKQKVEDERIAKAKAEAERKAKERAVPVEAKAAPVSFAPAQKKPASNVMMYGIGAVVLLVVLGIGFAMLRGGNKNTPVSTPTNQVAVVAPATEAPATEAPVTEVPVTEVLIDPTLTDQPTLSPSVSRPTIDGLASETEWVEATVYDLPHGKLYYQNDDDYLYVLIDLIEDTEDNIVGLGADSFWFTFDVNENKVVDANKDLFYSFSGDGRFGFFYYLDCVTSTGVNPSNSEAGEGFGPSFSSTIPHRIWELAFALDEIQATPGQRVRFGIVIDSGLPPFRDNIPESFSSDCDFSKLVEIDLERP